MKQVLLFKTGKPVEIVEVPDEETILTLKNTDGSETELHIITMPFNLGMTEELYVYASDYHVTHADLKKAARELHY